MDGVKKSGPQCRAAVEGTANPAVQRQHCATGDDDAPDRAGHFPTESGAMQRGENERIDVKANVPQRLL